MVCVFEHVQTGSCFVYVYSRTSAFVKGTPSQGVTSSSLINHDLPLAHENKLAMLNCKVKLCSLKVLHLQYKVIP